MVCRRIEARLEALARVCRDRDAHLEYRWLCAKEQGDESAIGNLARADHELDDRMRVFISWVRSSIPPALAGDRRRRYGWLRDQYLERYAGACEPECDCVDCKRGARP
jgi:hypothetical protein